MTLRPWEVLESRVLLDRKWLRVREEKVKTGGGAVIDEFHVLDSPAWAAIICVTAQKELVLVEQYRHGHGGVSLELPAGVIEPGEAPLFGAQRELLEETGYVAEGWTEFWKGRPEPARGSHWAHFVVSTNAKKESAPRPDETEDLRVALRPLSELDQVPAEMVHTSHVAALLYALRLGHLSL